MAEIERRIERRSAEPSQVAVVTDSRSRILGGPVADYLAGLGYAVRLFHVAASGEIAEKTQEWDLDLLSFVRGGANGIYISSSGSGLGMIANKLSGVLVASSPDETTASQVALLPNVNGCEIFAGLFLTEILAIAGAFLETKKAIQ